MRIQQPQSATSKPPVTHQAEVPEHDAIGSLAHDLRSFLHVLKVSLSVLRASRTDEAVFEEMLDILERDQQQALPRLNQLIEVARNPKPEGGKHGQEDTGKGEVPG